MPEIIYGRNPVIEALRAGKSVEKIFIAEGIKGQIISEIAVLAKRNGVPVERVSRQKLSDRADNSNTQGVVAFFKSQSYASLEDIFSKCGELNEPPLVALLDGIEDPHNLGAIIRSADGAGLHGIILPKKRSAGLTSTVVKTSAGASNYVLTVQVSNLNYTIETLKKKNIWIAGTDQNAGQSFTEADLSGPLAIVIGAEGRGMHRLIKENCDFLVSIPMFGKMNSLNASVAAALLFFEARRQRQLNRSR